MYTNRDYGIICGAMEKKSFLVKSLRATAAVTASVVCVFSAVATAYDDMAEAIDPSAATNGGFWNTAGRSAVMISTATSGVAAVNGVFRSIAESRTIPIRSDKFRSIIFSFR